MGRAEPSGLRNLAVQFRPIRPSTGGVALSVATQVAATLLAALFLALGVSNAAIVYLLPVVAVGTVFGSRPAIANGLAAFLIYDFLFVRPVHTFDISAPEEWLDSPDGGCCGRSGARPMTRRATTSTSTSAVCGASWRLPIRPAPRRG